MLVRDWDIKDSPLYLAASLGRSKVLKALCEIMISFGDYTDIEESIFQKVEKQNDYDLLKTSVQIARKNNHLDCVKILHTTMEQGGFGTPII